MPHLSIILILIVILIIIIFLKSEERSATLFIWVQLTVSTAKGLAGDRFANVSFFSAAV